MKVLVVGSGGREHAIAYRLAKSHLVSKVWVAPGNPGTASEPRCENVALDIKDNQALADFAEQEGIDLTVIGPEAPLVNGVVDVFRQRGLKCFGPRAAAAQLEGSKSFAKHFMEANNIPTASHKRFDKLEPALSYLEQVGAPIVIKADGLAAGKGVVVAHSLADAQQAVHDMLGAKQFGDASASIIVESFLEGTEASYIVLCDGQDYVPLATSQDHKRLLDNDLGPNTGGMGAYSPVRFIDRELDERIRQEIVEPTIKSMAQRGTPFVGFLYVGLMIDKQGNPSVLEYNVRLGDPETQPLMMRLESDLAALLLGALNGTLKQEVVAFDPRPCVGVVMAAKGYPLSPVKGDAITGIDAANAQPDTYVFHAGTKQDGEQLNTSGGRVLCVCALGDNHAQAAEAAYQGVKSVQFEGAQWRQDIARQALD